MTLNEIALSSDIKQIELEINHHKNIAGQSIWEIGRRLNHVKENDLAHGEFIKWVEGIGINHPEANRMMRVAKELRNSSTLTNLGSTALYLISTLPEEDRTKEHTTEKGETKMPDEMTVKELQELKRKLKLAEQDVATKQSDIDRQSKEIKLLKQQETKVIEQTVEVIPEDYQEIKSSLDHLEKRNDFLEQEQRRLESEREEVNKKSQKYDQLTEAIKDAESNLNHTQQHIAGYKHLINLIDKSYEFLLKASALSHFDLSDLLRENPFAEKELDRLATATERFLKELRSNKTTNIIEGEIIND